MQTINEFNETNQVLHSYIASKDATIKRLRETIKKLSNETISATELSMVIFVSSSDEMDHREGKVVKLKWNPNYFTSKYYKYLNSKYYIKTNLSK